jgi:phosphoserine phosphatase RsbU/P
VSTPAGPRARSAQWQYAAIAVLFIATALFQWFNQRDNLRSLVRPQSVVNMPFGISDSDNHISRVYGAAEKAGIRQNDLLLAVNGQPYRGLADLATLLAASHAGDSIAVTFSSGAVSSGDATRTVNVRLQERVAATRWSLNQIIFATLGIFVPIFCIALGFWTVLARPRDYMAWLLLAVLLGFTQILLEPLTARWPGWIYYVSITYRTLLNGTWPAWMLLFGIYFPEPFPQGRWRTLSKVLMWVLLPPLAFDTLASLYINLGGYHDYQTVAWLDVLNPMAPFLRLAVYFSIGFFTIALAVKYRLAGSPDARRRLALLYVGSFFSLVPAITITLVSVHKGVSPDQLIPAWLLFIILLLVLFFPLTLAYVIVVHRAVDVRVALRQGLQYALASNGVVALRIIASSVVIFAAATLATDATRNRSQKIEAIALGFLAIFLLRRGAAKLRAWTDRRFFRDAYNAEQILTDLSDEVRTIIEPKALLQIVAQRIADSLHVRQVAVLLNNSGPYLPAYEMGYTALLNLQFAPDAGTVKQLLAERQPARVYMDDPNSWVNSETEISADERARLLQLHAELLLPLSTRDKLLGFISLGRKLSEEPYSRTDLRLLQSVAAQTGMALENAQLTDAMAREMAQREKLHREIEIAREVQERLFPQQLPPIAGLDYFGKCRPALGVGGDYYDFVFLPGGKLGIAIGDVAGKGISAALMMASLQACLRGQALAASSDLALVVGNINHLVYEASSSNRYATFFYAEYDPLQRELNYVNAGHNPPMLLRRCEIHARNKKQPGDLPCDCRVERLEASGTVVGLIDHMPYEQRRVMVAPGDMLVAYTDGVSEAMNLRDEEWGEDSMLKAIEKCCGTTADEIVNAVLTDADAFAAGAPQFDDMTLVVVRAI